jgi:hypothetical protein
MIYLSIHVPPAAGERLACFYLPPLRGALTWGAKSRLRGCGDSTTALKLPATRRRVLKKSRDLVIYPTHAAPTGTGGCSGRPDESGHPLPRGAEAARESLHVFGRRRRAAAVGGGGGAVAKLE